ncbi:rhomboid family intramembrane serine protease [Desulfosarcina sp. OttesenSCG-928-G10]|nr:rhomboid family intramembrane serine protease [Desulfosarcina sp. OttesenSCG-928-G10]
MLIIPLSSKRGLKNPPVITLALVILNVLVYLFFQLGDDDAYMKAEFFYLGSGLAEIELPLYHDYLKAKGDIDDGELPDESNVEARNDALMELHFRMERDYYFLESLTRGQVIRPDDADYEKWQELRQEYERLRNRSVAFSHGLRPAYPEISDFFTSMFLHGGFGHLFGNMLFLWLLGSLIELGTRRVFFAVTYLFSGLMADVIFWAVYPLSTTPSVGASGAIAGLMGVYAVLYGKKKVAVFYSLGFYFNTAHISAIILLPVCLLKEVIDIFTGPSYVAYMAHIGGMVGGAAIAAVGKRIRGQVATDRFEEVIEDKISPLMDQAMDHLGNLEMKPAQALLERVLEMSPDHPAALAHLFNIHKLNPGSDAFHDVAGQLLAVYLKKPEAHPMALSLYRAYSGIAAEPSLPALLFLQLADVMTAGGDVDGAERIILLLIQKHPTTPNLPFGLVKLANAFHKIGQDDKWQYYRNLVCSRFPDSAEAAIILRSEHAPPA